MVATAAVEFSNLVEEDVQVPLPLDVVENTTEIFRKFSTDMPYSPITDHGRGFLPVFVRSIGHILYLVGRYDDTAKSKPTSTKAKEELHGAITHWQQLNLNIGFSAKATEQINMIREILDVASAHIDNWTAKESLENLQIIANRMVQLAANLDREVLGLRDSDAGFNL